MSEPYELSEREIEIIRLVATGASNKEIAQKLVISPNTVKVHLRNIFTKLEVASRTEATMVAIREGWVDAPGSQNATTLELQTPGKLGEESANQRNRKWYLVGGSIFVVLVLVVILIVISLTNNQAQEIPTAFTTDGQQRWSELSVIPEKLSQMAAARYEQYFYLIGGKDSQGASNQVLIYEINNDQWSKGSEKPNAVMDIGAVILGEDIYVPGGVDSSGRVLSLLESYSPRDDKWESHKNLPGPLSEYAAIAYEGKMYLFGGWDGEDYSNEVLVYDPILNDWQSFAKMKHASAGAVAVLVGGKIHIIGGHDQSGPLKTHDIFIPQRQLEGENPWEKAAPLPEARYGMGASVLADMVYLVGGYDKDGKNLDLIQYLPPKDEWVIIDQPPESVGISPAVLPYETRLYVLGGESAEGLTDTHQVYQAVYTILVPVVR